MERYEFKVKGPKEKCVKIFLSAEEVKTLELKSFMSRTLTWFPSLHGKELSLKYADTLNDWIELPADDLDSFVDTIETAKDCKGKPYHYWTQSVRTSSNSTTNWTETSSLFAIAKLRENVGERACG